MVLYNDVDQSLFTATLGKKSVGSEERLAVPSD